MLSHSNIQRIEEERNSARDVKEELKTGEEIQENVVAWDLEEESVSRKKEWPVAMSDTEMAKQVCRGSGHRKLIDDLNGIAEIKGITQPLNGVG